MNYISWALGYTHLTVYFFVESWSYSAISYTKIQFLISVLIRWALSNTSLSGIYCIWALGTFCDTLSRIRIRKAHPIRCLWTIDNARSWIWISIVIKICWTIKNAKISWIICKIWILTIWCAFVSCIISKCQWI